MICPNLIFISHRFLDYRQILKKFFSFLIFWCDEKRFRYNELCELSSTVLKDLERLRDPLQQHLPANRLASLIKLKNYKNKLLTNTVEGDKFKNS